MACIGVGYVISGTCTWCADAISGRVQARVVAVRQTQHVLFSNFAHNSPPPAESVTCAAPVRPSIASHAPLGVFVPHIVWLWNIVTAWGMYEYARDRCDYYIPSIVSGRKLKQSTHKPFCPICVAQMETDLVGYHFCYSYEGVPRN